MSADRLWDADNAFAATIGVEQDIYQQVTADAAVLRDGAAAEARDTYHAALDAADRLYAKTIDTAWQAYGEASAQARHVRDQVVDDHRHAITDTVPAAITDGTITGTVVKPPRRRAVRK